MPNANNSTGYRGVVWDECKQAYRAMIRFNKKLHHLGYHPTAEDAADAYDEAATDLYGKNARINRPRQPR